VDDMVASNPLLYGPGDKPDHTVVIKYVPYVGDSKRAMDEYVSQIMMGGTNTIAIHNTCEDSLLAAPLILDLAILAELCQRISFRVGKDEEAVCKDISTVNHDNAVNNVTKSDSNNSNAANIKKVAPSKSGDSEFEKFNSALSVLSLLCKAPLCPQDTPVTNAFFKQRACIENILRACLGLHPLNYMGLEYKHREIDEQFKISKSNKTAASSNGVYSNGMMNGVKSNGYMSREESEDKVLLNGER